MIIKKFRTKETYSMQQLVIFEGKWYDRMAKGQVLTI